MTLDEAIKKYTEMAEQYTRYAEIFHTADGACSVEEETYRRLSDNYAQITDWLTELKAYRALDGMKGDHA